jgi:hypothetical protein
MRNEVCIAARAAYVTSRGVHVFGISFLGRRDLWDRHAPTRLGAQDTS